MVQTEAGILLIPPQARKTKVKHFLGCDSRKEQNMQGQTTKTERGLVLAEIKKVKFITKHGKDKLLNEKMNLLSELTFENWSKKCCSFPAIKAASLDDSNKIDLDKYSFEIVIEFSFNI